MTPDYTVMHIRSTATDMLIGHVLHYQELMPILRRTEPETVQRAEEYKAKCVAELRRRNGVTA